MYTLLTYEEHYVVIDFDNALFLSTGGLWSNSVLEALTTAQHCTKPTKSSGGMPMFNYGSVEEFCFALNQQAYWIQPTIVFSYPHLDSVYYLYPEYLI